MPPPKKEAALSHATSNQDSNTAVTLQHPGITIKEYAWSVSLHPKTVAKWIRTGKLNVLRLPSGRVRIILEAIK